MSAADEKETREQSVRRKEGRRDGTSGAVDEGKEGERLKLTN